MQLALMMTVLLAAGDPAGVKIRHDAEERARAAVADLLRSLCPEQCLLLSVEAAVENEQLPGTAPGFDAPQGVPVLRKATASVLTDARLPPAFRSQLKNLVAQRMRELGVPAQVSIDAVPFPPKVPEPQPPAQVPPPTPAAQTPPPSAAPIEQRAGEKLADAAPLLAIAMLCALVILMLGALLVVAMRRREDVFVDEEAPATPPEPAKTPAARFPELRRRRLEKQLAEGRALRNDVIRATLDGGEHALIAAWVHEIGEFLLDDFRGDRHHAQALEAVADELQRPRDVNATVAALQELEGRLLGARLRRTSERAEEAFAFLEGARPDTFAAACGELAPNHLQIVLRFAPQLLRAEALRHQSAARRDALALAWARSPEVEAAAALAAADELRSRLSLAAGSAGQAERALADLLDLLPRGEQDALVEKLRRDGDPRIASGLMTESALAAAPAEVAAAAAVAVPPEQLLVFLRGADLAVRDRVVQALPERIRVELLEEMEIGVAGPKDAFFLARRDLLTALREEALRRRIDPRDWSRSARPHLEPVAALGLAP